MSALFGAKTLDFSKFMVCPHGQRGLSQYRHLADKGVNFSQFCADVLYERPLSWKLHSSYKILSFTLWFKQWLCKEFYAFFSLNRTVPVSRLIDATLSSSDQAKFSKTLVEWYTVSHWILLKKYSTLWSDQLSNYLKYNSKWIKGSTKLARKHVWPKTYFH